MILFIHIVKRRNITLLEGVEISTKAAKCVVGLTRILRSYCPSTDD